MKGPSKFATILAGLAMGFAVGAAPSAKLWNGTWHLNVARSKFASPGKKVSETRTYAISGNKVRMTSRIKDAAGKTLSVAYSAAFDGKYYPMTGNPNGDRIALTAVSDREMKWKSTHERKSSVEGSATVSADGKHLTLTRKLLKIKGTPTDVLEFDR